MVNKVKIIVDSTFSFTQEYIKNNDILVANLGINVDGEELDININNEEVENFIHDGRSVKTTCPSPQIFEALYEKALQEGATNILVFTISKSLSGTYNSAIIARKNLDDDIKNSKIKIIDTAQVSYGSSYVVMKAIEMLKNNIAVDEVIKQVNVLIPRGKFFFIVDDLKTIKKNGRLNLVKYIIAKTLGIIPIGLYQNGELRIFKNAIGYKRVKQALISEIKNLYIEHENLDIFCADSNSREKVVLLENELIEIFKNANVKYQGPISNIITAQVGPGALGLYINHD